MVRVGRQGRVEPIGASSRGTSERAKEIAGRLDARYAPAAP